MAQVFLPDHNTTLDFPDDATPAEMQQVLSDFRAGAPNTAPSWYQAIPIAGQIAQQIGNAPITTTLPNIRGSDVVGLAPEQTQSVIGTLQQDAQTRIQARLEQNRQNQVALEREKDRSLALKVEAARQKNQEAEFKLREKQGQQQIGLEQQRVGMEGKRLGLEEKRVAQTATEQERRFGLDVLKTQAQIVDMLEQAGLARNVAQQRAFQWGAEQQLREAQFGLAQKEFESQRGLAERTAARQDLMAGMDIRQTEANIGMAQGYFDLATNKYSTDLRQQDVENIRADKELAIQLLSIAERARKVQQPLDVADALLDHYFDVVAMKDTPDPTTPEGRETVRSRLIALMGAQQEMGLVDPAYDVPKLVDGLLGPEGDTNSKGFLSRLKTLALDPAAKTAAMASEAVSGVLDRILSAPDWAASKLKNPIPGRASTQNQQQESAVPGQTEIPAGKVFTNAQGRRIRSLGGGKYEALD